MGQCLALNQFTRLNGDEKRVSLTAIFRARLSAFFLAANFFSVILFSMMASSSLVKGRKVGRLLSDSFSA